MSKIFTRLNLDDIAHSNGGKCFKRLSTGKTAFEAGLYLYDLRVASWRTLTDTYGMDVDKHYTNDAYLTDSSSPYYVLTKSDKLAKGVKLVIDDGVKYIGFAAFHSCTTLTSIVIPDSVTKIYNQTFWGCSNLTSIVIPDSVTSIGASAFHNCSALKDIYYTGTEDEWAAITIDLFNDALTNATIHYNYTT